jgi:hypothetical protein
VRNDKRRRVVVAIFACAALAAALGACAKKAEESGVPGGALGIGGPGICPACDAGKNVIPVVYGKPGRENRPGTTAARATWTSGNHIPLRRTKKAARVGGFVVY